MEVDWGEVDGGGVEAPEPPLRPVEAAARLATGRLAGVARRPAGAGREPADWRLTATAGSALVAEATGMAGVTGVDAVAELAAAVLAAGVASAGADTAIGVMAAAGGDGAAAEGRLAAVAAAGEAAAGWDAADPGAAGAAAPALAEVRVREVRLTMVQVRGGNRSGAEGSCRRWATDEGVTRPVPRSQ
jgi:hypothetical protein